MPKETERTVPKWALELPWSVIRVYAERYGLDPNLIAAIMQAESAGNTYAMRYEPKWKYFLRIEDFAKETISSVDTERVGQATSWGLMQVMGTVARERGFKGWFSELCNPETGIKYGCAHLDVKLAKYRKMDDTIAAYNAGSPIRNTQNQYINQNYVDKVLGYYSQLP